MSIPNLPETIAADVAAPVSVIEPDAPPPVRFSRPVSGRVRIAECGDADRDAWNTYVDSHPDASLYHRFEWRAINQQSFGHETAYLAARDDRGIVGIYPIVHVKSMLFGRIGCSMPFVNYGGPCGDSEAVEQLLFDAGASVADRWGVDYLEIRSKRNLGDHLPTSRHKVSMTLALTPNPDETFEGFDRTHRKDIRRGYKNGFVVKRGGAELVDDFYEILSETWRDAGTPIYSKDYIVTAMQALPQHLNITVVYHGDEIAAAALDGFQNGIAEGLWLGARAKFKRELVGYVLYWEVIKHACERGLVRYHLGRSTAGSGAETFKRKWNATPTQLYWHYVLRSREEIPQLNVANGRFRLAIDFWQRLPVSVTKLIGPFIARNIP